MKENLCNLFSERVKILGLSFSEVAKVCGMSKTQVNHIINHKGKEVSLEKVMNGLCSLGLTINFTIEEKK